MKIFTFVKSNKSKNENFRDSMKDRIAHIMRAKNLKASDFATLLGIQPSGISHILSGRNQPSLDFVKKIKENFPEYNLDWIIFGTGPITTSDPFPKTTADLSQEPELEFTPIVDPVPNIAENHSNLSPTLTDKAPSSIKSMLILYNDGTFESYSPR